MIVVAWNVIGMGSEDGVAMEGKATRVVDDEVLWLLGLCTRDGLEEGGKEKAGCNTLVCFLSVTARSATTLVASLVQ
jgi:hypothetical protein